MDPVIFPKLYHPRAELLTWDLKSTARYCTRTERPTRYYFIDFGISVKFDKDDPHPVAEPIIGGDRTVPEYQNEERVFKPRDPFPTDVYYLGNVARQDILQVCYRSTQHSKWLTSRSNMKDSNFWSL